MDELSSSSEDLQLNQIKHSLSLGNENNDFSSGSSGEETFDPVVWKRSDLTGDAIELDIVYDFYFILFFFYWLVVGDINSGVFILSYFILVLTFLRDIDNKGEPKPSGSRFDGIYSFFYY